MHLPALSSSTPAVGAQRSTRTRSGDVLEQALESDLAAKDASPLDRIRALQVAVDRSSILLRAEGGHEDAVAELREADARARRRLGEGAAPSEILATLVADLEDVLAEHRL
jgi:hypothetical protein